MEAEHVARHDRDALAALEIHIERIVMSQDNTGKGPGLEQIDRFGVGFSKQKTHKQQSQKALDHISQKNNEAGFCAQYTHGICRSCISASVFADINSFAPAEDICCLKNSECVTNHQANEPQHQQLIHKTPPFLFFGAQDSQASLENRFISFPCVPV